ncbi:glycosyltransferase domain-containing protein [Salmonella enterica]
MNKIAIYTCITGGYDFIKAPLKINDDIDYICFSDQKIPASYPWKIINISDLEISEGFDEKTINRAIKICPQKFGLLEQYELTIYIDGSIEIIDDLSLLIDFVAKQDDVIFMYDHFLRNCLYDEAEECLLIGYDWYWNIRKQVRNYRQKGFPVSYGLFECGIIIRKKSQDLNIIMWKWFEEYIKGVKRDQLSLTYILWESNYHLCSLGESDARYKNRHFKLHKHSIKSGYYFRKFRSKLNKVLIRIFGGL